MGNKGEDAVAEYYRKKKFSVFKIDPKGVNFEFGLVTWRGKFEYNICGKKGAPDFFVCKGKEQFYVEVKKNKNPLADTQRKVISELINNGNKVFLVKYIVKRDTIKIYELGENLMLNFIEEVIL